MAFVNSSQQEVLSHVRSRFIVLSLTAALLLNLLPLQGLALLLRPDFVALVVLYWSINQPQRVGMSVAFTMGLLMDVGDASIFGQHALAYSVMAFIALLLHRRLRIFSLYKQAPQVGLLLLSAQLIILLTGLLAGANLPGWDFFLASASGMLLWPLLPALVKMPQRRKPDPDAL
ncbi:MAG: rod shape-determining protein MreD [Nitrosomonadaceae bacterium]|nr:rod shape-determining protein MreD [Nitrosomonadaceae bacterium]